MPADEFGKAAVGRGEVPAEALVDFVAEVGAVGVAEGQFPAAEEGLGVEPDPVCRTPSLRR